MCNEFCRGWMIVCDRNCNHTCWLPVLLPLEELLLLVMEGLAKKTLAGCSLQEVCNPLRVSGPNYSPESAASSLPKHDVTRAPLHSESFTGPAFFGRALTALTHGSHSGSISVISSQLQDALLQVHSAPNCHLVPLFSCVCCFMSCPHAHGAAVQKPAEKLVDEMNACVRPKHLSERFIGG